MAVRLHRKLTYNDYALIPDDGRRHELIDGEVYVNPAPNTRHQDVSGFIYRHLGNHLEAHGGGRVFSAPCDVVLSDTDVVQPDVIFVSDQDAGVITKANIKGVPTLVVEVVSDRKLDQQIKRDLYARYRVPEYWVVDPDAGRVEVYRLAGHSYDEPGILEPGQTLATEKIPGFALVVRAGVEAVAQLEQRRAVDQSIVKGYKRMPPTAADEAAALGSLRDAILEEPW